MKSSARNQCRPDSEIGGGINDSSAGASAILSGEADRRLSRIDWRSASGPASGAASRGNGCAISVIGAVARAFVAAAAGSSDVARLSSSREVSASCSGSASAPNAASAAACGIGTIADSLPASGSGNSGDVCCADRSGSAITPASPERSGIRALRSNTSSIRSWNNTTNANTSAASAARNSAAEASARRVITHFPLPGKGAHKFSLSHRDPATFRNGFHAQTTSGANQRFFMLSRGTRGGDRTDLFAQTLHTSGQMILRSLLLRNRFAQLVQFTAQRARLERILKRRGHGCEHGVGGRSAAQGDIAAQLPEDIGRQHADDEPQQIMHASFLLPEGGPAAQSETS